MAEAEAIVAEAKAQAEELRRSAYDRGYQEGLELSAGQYCLAIKQLEDLMNGLRDEREAFFSRAEPQVVKLSVEIAEKILRHELETKPEAVLDIVKIALLQLVGTDSIVLRVSPHDAEVIKQHRDVLEDAAGGVRRIEIIEDRRVDQGGCIAECSSGSLDARLSSQLSEVNRALTEATGDDRDADGGSEQV
jgi:flagellar assembly protein FliH